MLGQKLDPKLALLEMVETMKAKKTVNGWLYWNTNAGNTAPITNSGRWSRSSDRV